MGSLFELLFATCVTFSIFHHAQSQSQQGFISLDCGLPFNESPYNEPLTNLSYVSDAEYIPGGKIGNIQKELETLFLKPYRTLRYFPDGIRNCYNLKVTQDTKYLIKTVFIYGNYDGQNAPPIFDLYLGPNIWTTVDVKASGLRRTEEIIHITRSNNLDICVVKTGTTTPIISAIELRPVQYDTYIAQTGSLKLVDRRYFKNSEKFIRFPEDIYDRVWTTYFDPYWTEINTKLNVVDSKSIYNGSLSNWVSKDQKV